MAREILEKPSETSLISKLDAIFIPPSIIREVRRQDKKGELKYNRIIPYIGATAIEVGRIGEYLDFMMFLQINPNQSRERQCENILFYSINFKFPLLF